MDNVHLALGGSQLLEGASNSVHGALNIRLDDEVQVGDFTRSNPAGGVLKRGIGHGLPLRLQPLSPLLNQVLGRLLVRHHPEGVSGKRELPQAEDLDRSRRIGGSGPPSGFADHRLHSAPGVADNHGVSHSKGARLHEDSRERSLALVHLGLHYDPNGGAFRVRLQLRHLGNHQNVLQKLLNALSLPGRYRHGNHVSAPFLNNQAALHQLALHSVHVCRGHVYLVDGDHNRHSGCPRVVHSFHGLGHYAVVRGHHQNGDVCRPGSPGPHGGESLVARSV